MSRKPQRWESALHEYEFHELATYNAEVSRGLLHTKKQRDKMAQLQRFYDAAMKPMESNR